MRKCSEAAAAPLNTEDYLSAGHQCLPRPIHGALLVFKDGRTSIRVAVVGGGGSSLAAAAARGQDLATVGRPQTMATSDE